MQKLENKHNIIHNHIWVNCNFPINVCNACTLVIQNCDTGILVSGKVTIVWAKDDDVIEIKIERK